MRKYFIWYRAFVKRLFHKISFIVLLCLIPVMLPLGNAAMSDDSGVLTIALSSENADETSQSIIENLTNRSSMIKFKEYKKNAVEAVESGEADAAWIFKENTGERIDKYAAKKSLKPIVEVYEREDSVPLKISREVLYESLYEKLAFSVYKNYVREALAADITDEELSAAYQKERLGDIIEIKRFNSDTLVKKTNYLTSPFRGFLSIIIFLCAMAGAMFFLEDDKQGKYAWLSSKKKIVPAFGMCFSAASLAALFGYAAILLSGISVGACREFISMLLFCAAAAGFAVICCIIFVSPESLGACIPGIMIAALVLSPIFFNLQVLKCLRLLLPTHYYLYSINDVYYIIYMAAYTAAVYVLICILNLLKKR